MKIFLSKDIINNVSYEALCVYIALRYIMDMQRDRNQNNFYISLHMLAFVLTDTAGYQKRFYKSLKDGLTDLINNKIRLIGVIEKLNKYGTEYILDLSNLHVDTDNEHFTIIDYEEMKSIMNINTNNESKVDRFRLLKYFTVVIGSINKNAFIYNGLDSINNFVGELTIEKLAELSGLDRTTVIDYNKKLEDIKLLYVHRSDDFTRKDNGELKSISNAYGRYKDKNYIIKYASSKADVINSEKCNKRSNRNKANKKNSLLQKYNALSKPNFNGHYTDNEIIEIYEFIIQYNKEQDKIIEKYKDNDYKYANDMREKAYQRKKDTSVFDKFEFLATLISKNENAAND